MDSSPFQFKVRLSGNITKVPVTSSRKHISCLLAFLVCNEGPFVLENVLQDCQVLLERMNTCLKQAVVLSQRQQDRPCLGIPNVQLSFSLKFTFHVLFCWANSFFTISKDKIMVSCEYGKSLSESCNQERKKYHWLRGELEKTLTVTSGCPKIPNGISLHSWRNYFILSCVPLNKSWR